MNMIQLLQSLPDIIIIALTIFCEGEGEPFAGKILIADTIVNRALIYKKSLRNICLERRGKSKFHQYSCWNNYSLVLSKLKNKKANSQAWKECLDIAKQISNPDYIPSSRVTHYLNPKLVKKLPKWTNVYNKVAVVENHIFYSEISLEFWNTIKRKNNK